MIIARKFYYFFWLANLKLQVIVPDWFLRVLQILINNFIVIMFFDLSVILSRLKVLIECSNLSKDTSYFLNSI